MPVVLLVGALGQLVLRLAAHVVLRVDVALGVDLEVEALGERVDDRDADAVEAARDLVAAAVAELAAGVEDGQHDLGGRLALLLHDADRDAAAVVDDGDRVVRVDRDLDGVAVAGERLVDGVVDDLVDEVVKAADTGRADVHAGALADRFEPLEDGDVLRPVACPSCRRLPFAFALSATRSFPFGCSFNHAVPGGGSEAAVSPRSRGSSRCRGDPSRGRAGRLT